MEVELTTEQEQELVLMYFEEYGANDQLQDFSEVIRGWFEDIAGFDLIAEKQIQANINRMWRLYEQQRNQSTGNP